MRIGQDELNFRRRQARIHRIHHRPRLGRAKHHLIIDRGVLGQISKALIRLNTESQQPIRHLITMGVELCKTGRLAFEKEGRLIRAFLGLITRYIRQMRHGFNINHVHSPKGIRVSHPIFCFLDILLRHPGQ